MSVKQTIKQILPRSLHPLARLAFLYAAAGVTYAREGLQHGGDGAALPPMMLRHRVHGRLDRKSFLEVGEACAADMRDALRKIGKDIDSFRSILDFGCGCARVLPYFEAFASSAHFYGTDIDGEAIDWCRQNINFAEFAINNPLPPLPYENESFDFLYAISIFTHLDEKYQLAWLEELRRVTKPGAILLFTSHGSYAQSKLTESEKTALARMGFLFKTEATGWLKADGLPDFYQNAYHAKKYIEETWSKFFKIRLYRERGMNRHQDLILLERK